MAGHRWTIRHAELDYERFRWDQRRYLNGEDGGGGDNNGDNGMDNHNNSSSNNAIVIVVQSRPNAAAGHRVFECRLLAPSPANASSQQQAQTAARKFVQSFVKIHERWRSRNGLPRLADVGGGEGQQQQRQRQPTAKRRVVPRKSAGRGFGTVGGAGGVGRVGPPPAAFRAALAADGEDGTTRRVQLLRGGKSNGKGKKRKAAEQDDYHYDDVNDDDYGAAQGVHDGVGVSVDVGPMVLEDTDDEDGTNVVVAAGNKSKPGIEAEAEAEVQAEVEECKASTESANNDTTANHNATELLWAAKKVATTNTAAVDNAASKSKVKPNAKTVTPTPTASTASRKDQQSKQQQQQQQGILTNFFGAAATATATANKAGGGGRKAKTKATTKTDSGDDDEKKGEGIHAKGRTEDRAQCEMYEEKDAKMDTADDNGNGSDDDDIADGRDQPTTYPPPVGSPRAATYTTAPPGNTGRVNRRRNAAYGRGRPSASSQAARGGIDPGLVGLHGLGPRGLGLARSPTNGGGIGPPAKKRTVTSTSSSMLSANEDPFTFVDDGRPTPTSYLPAAADLSSRMMGSLSPSRRRRSATANANANGNVRSRSSSPSKSPSGGRLFLATKSPRNATPSRRTGSGSQKSFERPVGQRLGGKELFGQQARARARARAGSIDSDKGSDDEYVRTSRTVGDAVRAAGGDEGDEDATTLAGGGNADEDDASRHDGGWSSPTNTTTKVKNYAIFDNRAKSMPSTPTKTHSPRHPSTPPSTIDAIMPGGRAPSRSRGGRRHGTPAPRRGSDGYGSDYHSASTTIRRSTGTWGASLAKKGNGIVREGPYDNLEDAPPDSPVAVRNLDDRFGRCEPPMPPTDDGLCDTDDEDAHRSNKRNSNNPYRLPNESNRYRERMENDRQSRYFRGEGRSTADSALDFPSNPMLGGRGRGRNQPNERMTRGRKDSEDERTPRHHDKRARFGYENRGGRSAWRSINPYSENRNDASGRSNRRRNGSGIDRAAERAKNNVATGLRNLGNTCYLNSSLQTLFSVPGFATDLLSARDRIVAKHNARHDDGSKAKLPLANALIDTAIDLGVLRSLEPAVQAAGEAATEGGGRSPNNRERNMFANPKELKKVIDALTDWFRGFQQQDAHEVIGYLIDALHDELSAATKEAKGGTGAADGGSNAMENDIVLPTDKYFRLEAEEQNFCVDCNSTSGPYMTLYRHVPVAITEDEDNPEIVEQILRNHFSREIRELKCEKCPCEKVYHTAKITQNPVALLLCFKRFVLVSNTASEGQNNNTKPADKENHENNGGGGEDKGTKDSDGGGLPPLESTNDPSAANPTPAVAVAAVPVIHRSKGRVLLQESICLDPFCKKEEKKGDEMGEENEEQSIDDTTATEPQLYRAVGVVHHIGSTPHSGHYTADALRCKDLGLFDDNIGEEEKNWVTFDDTATTNTDKASVLDKEASQRNTYMAMYVAE